MVFFLISIVLFNSVAYKMNKHLTKNQIVHIWEFSIILEITFDIFIDEKTNGYWYFLRGIDWTNILVYTVLVPPVCVMFLNWFPFNQSWIKRIGFIVIWVIIISAYEFLSLQPWGYFHYGWWKLIYSVILDPILLLILLAYFKSIRKIEKVI